MSALAPAPGVSLCRSRDSPMTGAKIQSPVWEGSADSAMAILKDVGAMIPCLMLLI